MIGDFGERVDNLFYGWSRAKLEGNFEELRKKKIERGIKSKFFTLDEIEVDGIFLTEGLLGGLGKTVVTFTGGEDGDSRFGLAVKERHCGDYIDRKSVV